MSHSGGEIRRNVAAECFNHHVARCVGDGLHGPWPYLHARMLAGGHPVQCGGFIHPEADGFAPVGERAGQPPAHADVAVVVDDLAKYPSA